MNKKELLLLACTTENEQCLVNLLNNLNKSNSKEIIAETLAFKNVLLLVKSDLNNNTLNQLLLKNYVFFLYSINDNVKYTKSSKEESLITVFNSYVLNGDIDKALELLNRSISIKYYLSYIYVNTMTGKGLYRVTNINKDNYEQVGILLEKINYETVQIENSKKKNELKKIRCIKSNR